MKKRKPVHLSPPHACEASSGKPADKVPRVDLADSVSPHPDLKWAWRGDLCRYCMTTGLPAFNAAVQLAREKRGMAE